MHEEEKQFKEIYKPSDKDQERVEFVYAEYKDMETNVMQKRYAEFNMRTLAQYLDDSQKRANSFVLGKPEQGKDDWQSNVFTGMTRNKLRAFIASVAKEPPQTRIVAVNSENIQSFDRAEVMKHLVRHSYLLQDNPEKVIFTDAWNCGVNGTVIKYDAYMKTKKKYKIVKDYDSATGKVEMTEQEDVIEERPVEIDVPLNRFMIKNPYIENVQDQPAVCWLNYYTPETFKAEWGNFKNAKFVKTQSAISQGERDLFMGEKWQDRMDDTRIEVIHYYNKLEDIYRVVANGVLLLDAPLLWGRKKKYYPFAKTVFEYFANAHFFWGNSLPNILMPHQDMENSLWNSMVDKTYRTLVPPMLIGLQNKDAFDLEDEFVNGDTKIYVDDVNNVKPMPIAAVNQSEFNMMKLVGEQGSLASVDILQQGFSGAGVTAREIVLANERANEIKGIFFLMLKDLWVQKVRLRILNILMNYSRPVRLEKIIGKRKLQAVYQTFNVLKTQLSGNEVGTLQIRIIGSREEIEAANRIVGYKLELNGKIRPFNQLEVEEEHLRMQGQSVEILLIPVDFLDDWEYEIEVETESVFQKGKALDMALATEKITTIAKLFPEIFMANKDKFFADLMRQFEDNPERYLEGMSASQPMPGLPQLGSGALEGQLMGQMTQPVRSLPRLTGVEI